MSQRFVNCSESLRKKNKNNNNHLDLKRIKIKIYRGREDQFLKKKKGYTQERGY